MIQRREHNGAASVFPASLVCDGWCVGIWSWGQRCVTRGVVRVSKGRDGGFLCIGTLSIGIVRRGASCVVFPRRGTRVARGVGKREKGKPCRSGGGRDLETGQRIGLSATLAVPQLGDEEIDVEREVLSHPFLSSQSRPTLVARTSPPRDTPCRGRGRRSNAAPLRASCGPAAAPTTAPQPTTHPAAVSQQTSA